MTWTQSLLTDEASPAERAVEGVSAARWPLGWDVLRTLQSADRIPADKIEILAWALSVDIWNPAWSIEKKRSIVRNAIRDHSLKGTVAGISRYLSIVDARLVEVLAPPQLAFASRDLSKAEFDEWLATMPQLRIRLRSRPGFDPAFVRAFAGHGFSDLDFAAFEDARAYFGRQPFLYENGVETPLNNVEIITERRDGTTKIIERASVPGLGGDSFANRDYAGHAFADDTIIPAEFYTYSIDRSYIDEKSELAVNAVPAGYAPLNVRHTTTSDVGFGGWAAFVGDFADQYFVTRDEAEFLIFDRIYLHDPKKAAPIVDANTFADISRLGVPAFTAEIMIKVDEWLPADTAIEGDFADMAFAVPPDYSRMDAALDAVDLAKSYRDKALATFETTRARTWGDGLPMNGSVKIGDRVPATL